jgi:hypothetical protein
LKRGKWKAGTVWDNFAAAADAVGFENADIAWGLAQVPWESIIERDQFFDSLSAQRTRDLYGDRIFGG